MKHSNTRDGTRVRQRVDEVPCCAGAMSPDVTPPSWLTSHQPWKAVVPIVRELPRCGWPPRLRRTLTMSFELEALDAEVDVEAVAGDDDLDIAAYGPSLEVPESGEDDFATCWLRPSGCGGRRR